MAAGKIAGEFITNLISPDSLLEAFDQVASFLNGIELVFQYALILILFGLYIAILYYMGKIPIQLYTWYKEYRGVIRRIFKLDTF